MLDEIKDDKLDSLIAMDPETSLIESKEAIARQIVRDLPQPCDDLLWGFFRDNYSLKTLADILGKTVGYVKSPNIVVRRSSGGIGTTWQRISSKTL